MTVRNLQVKFTGKKIGEGRIPLNLLYKVLEGLQAAVYQIGEYHHSSIVTRDRGRYPKDVIEQCTLELTSIDKGSFIANLELPHQEQTELLPTLGENSLTSLVNLLDGLAEKEESIYQDIKDKKTVQKVLRTFHEVMPKSNDYSLELSSPKKIISPLTYKMTTKIERLLYTPTIFERELIGQIVEMKIVENRYFGILIREKIIRCHFPEEMDSEVIESIGKDVRITGEALVNEHGNVTSIRKVTDIRLIEPGTWSLEKIRWKNRIFTFSDGFSLDVDIEDDLWKLENKDLDIVVFDESFEEALNIFYEEFSMLWDEYALEEESSLSEDARGLKDTIQGMVERVLEE
jgi:hypothetical protein